MKYSNISAHNRKGKKGKIIRVRKHRRKKAPPTIKPRERKIFKHISDPKQHRVEYGGAIDFDKSGAVENINIAPGKKQEVYLEDFEVLYHTHPTPLFSLPTPEDLMAITRGKKQQAEIVFQDGKAYVIKKTPKVKKLAKMPTRKLFKKFDELFENADMKESDKIFKRDLEKLGFKVEINEDVNGPIEIDIEPKD